MHGHAQVLILEDDRLNRSSLQRLLGGLNLSVAAAASVAQALEALQELRDRPPRCLVLDIDLPDGSGVAVAQAARAIAPHCRIALMTGSLREEDVPFDPDAFFMKPVRANELLAWVQQACREHPTQSPPPPQHNVGDGSSSQSQGGPIDPR
jgi:CheY-like chemotaxis protein